MAERDRVFGRIEADLVGTGDSSRAICTEVQRPLIAAALHLFRESQQGARRRILLSSVVDLPAPGAVTLFARKPARRFRDGSPKVVKPNRKIRPPNNRRVLLLREFAHQSKLRKPPRRSYNRRYSGFDQATQILRRS